MFLRLFGFIHVNVTVLLAPVFTIVNHLVLFSPGLVYWTWENLPLSPGSPTHGPTPAPTTTTAASTVVPQATATATATWQPTAAQVGPRHVLTTRCLPQFYNESVTFTLLWKVIHIWASIRASILRCTSWSSFIHLFILSTWENVLQKCENVLKG